MRKKTFMATITTNGLVFLLVCFMLISLAEANFSYPPDWRWIRTPSITLTSPSDWTMNENVSVAFTVTMPDSWNGNIVGTVTSIQCLLDNNLVIEDATTHIYSNNGSPRSLNYYKMVGPLTSGYHTIAIRVSAYSVYSGEEAKNTASSTYSKTFAVGFEPPPTPIVASLSTPSGLYFGKTVFFHVEVEDQKQYNYTWYLDNQKVKNEVTYTGDSSYETSTLGIGEHEIYVEVTNDRNITGKTSTVTFNMLPSLPYVEIISPADNTVYNTSGISLETQTFAERVSLVNGSSLYETLNWLNYSVDGASYSFTNITFNKHHYIITLANTFLFNLPNGIHQVIVYGETNYGAKVISNATFWVYEGEVIPNPLPKMDTSPSPSPTLAPTLEPTQTATPTNDENQTLDLTPILALTGIAVIAITLVTLVYLKKRERS